MSGSVSGVRWETCLETAGSLRNPIICLCATGRLAVFPGTVPPAALNHSLFVLMPFLFLDIHPVLQHAARSPVRARLCTKHKAFPLAPRAPWPLGPVICHNSAHLCPTLWASACQDSPAQPSAGLQADLEGTHQKGASHVCLPLSLGRSRLPFSGLPWASGAFRHLSIYS